MMMYQQQQQQRCLQPQSNNNNTTTRGMLYPGVVGQPPTAPPPTPQTPNGPSSQMGRTSLCVQIPTANCQPLFDTGGYNQPRPPFHGGEGYIKCEVQAFGSSPPTGAGGPGSPMSSPGCLPTEVWRQQQQQQPQIEESTRVGGSRVDSEIPSILRNALTGKPRPMHQGPPPSTPVALPAAAVAYSCPAPNTLTRGQLLGNKSPTPPPIAPIATIAPIAAVKSEPVAAATDDAEEENRVFLSNMHERSVKPKYNFEAIKNYPPFRDAYNAALARRRSRSFGHGARQRSASESCPTSFGATAMPGPSSAGARCIRNSIRCSRCNQVLTSKCLVQRCQSVSEQTKCKTCGKELTTRCLLANCTN